MVCCFGGKAKELTILHFNDVYDIESDPKDIDPVGGAARFQWQMKQFKKEKPLILFSGDAYNPSMLSTITKGEQMVPVLNAMGVHVSCVGNHDFDWGVPNMEKLNNMCKFPWLMANVLDVETDKPLGGAGTHMMMTHCGRKVGIVGLVEEEWIATLGTVKPDQVKYIDFVELGRKLARELKAQGAELLIALTHMRVPNDVKLAEEVEEFDIIAGGHDHDIEIRMIEKHGNLLLKSGTDFRNLTHVKVTFPDVPGQRVGLTWKEIPILLSTPEDKEMRKIVDSWQSKMKSGATKVIGFTTEPLDGKFKTVRNAESNLGNFVCDLWKDWTGVDCVVLNSGSLRSDIIHPAGKLLRSDLDKIMPMIDHTVVLEVTGKQLLEVLENGVCMWPKLEGRFPQVSGIRFKFDPRQPPKSRIVAGSVVVNGDPLDLNKKYSMATKEYVASGKDGFDCLLEAKTLVDAENACVLPCVVASHFFKLEAINRIEGAGKQATLNKAKSRFMKSKSTHENTLAVRNKDGKIAIGPVLDGRITNVAPPPAEE